MSGSGAIILFGGTSNERRVSVASAQHIAAVLDEAAAWFLAPTGAVHPVTGDELAGFGTIALEISQQVDEIDAIVVPVSSGAVISGVAIGMRAFAPGVRVVGVEPALAADAQASLASGRLERLSAPPDTIADGARALSLTVRTFPLVTRLVDEIVTVSEDEILAATWWLWTRAKLLVEPTGALAFAAAFGKVDPFGFFW